MAGCALGRRFFSHFVAELRSRDGTKVFVAHLRKMFRKLSNFSTVVFVYLEYRHFVSSIIVEAVVVLFKLLVFFHLLKAVRRLFISHYVDRFERHD